jgi:ferredoxin
MVAKRKDDRDAGWLVRPPGAAPEETFLDLCVRCGDCVAVCPSHALTAGPGGRPQIASGKHCLECGLCADICMPGAIAFTPETREGLDLVLRAERATDGDPDRVRALRRRS